MVEPQLSGPNPDDPAWPFAQLATIVLGAEPLGMVLGRVGRLALQAIPEVSESSVTVLEDGTPRSIAFTGPLAAQLDERQYATGWGPCLHAAESGDTVVVDIEHAPEPYADFAQVAHRAGVVSSLSIGLPVASEIVGGLNLYSTTAVMDEAAQELATTFAGYAAVAVVNAARFSSAEDRAQNMMAAMQSRAVIEQAKGIIMARERCTPDQAFQVLVKASQHRNMKLRDVAAAIVRATRAVDGGRTGA